MSNTFQMQSFFYIVKISIENFQFLLDFFKILPVTIIHGSQCILWLELTPRSFVPLATIKSKVLPVQLAQDTAGS